MFRRLFSALWRVNILLLLFLGVAQLPAAESPVDETDLCGIASEAEFLALKESWADRVMELLFEEYRADSAVAVIDCLAPFALRDTVTVAAGKLYFVRGMTRFQQHDFDRSLRDYRRAIGAFTAAGDSSQQWYAQAYQKAGELAARLDENFMEAIEDHQRAIELFQHQRDTVNYLWTVHTLAQLYGRNYFFALARKERQLVFDWPGIDQYPTLLAVTHLVAAHESAEQQAEARKIHHLDEVARLLPIIDNRQIDFFLHSFYFMHYYGKEAAGPAGVRFDSLERAAGRMAGSPRFQEYLDKYRSFDHYLRGNYGAAERGIKPFLAVSLERRDYDQILNAYQLLTNVYRKTGRPALALKYADRKFALKDSLIRAAKLRETIYYENMFAAAERRRVDEARRAALAQSEMRNASRVRSGIGLAVVLFLVGLTLTLARKKGEQRRFARDLILARTRERQRIARDLHDTIGQEIVLLLRESKVIADTGLRRITNDLLGKVRKISHELYAPGPERLGLAESIEQLVARYDRSTPVFFSTELPDEFPVISRDTQHQLFAILQEALQNVVKHAGARAVLVQLKAGPQKLQLTVSDNGRGFAPQRADGGLGLRSMRERALMLKSRLQVVSAPESGTTISLNVPL